MTGAAGVRRAAITGVLATAVLLPAAVSAQTTARVPWRPGNADRFQAGAVEEQRARAEHGSLPVTLYAFDMRLPERTVLGMRLGYDAAATADARRRVIAFLTAHGVTAGGPRR